MSIFELTAAESPLVISVPHDGALIPDEIMASMNAGILNSSDRDYLIGEVFDFDDLKYSKIQANYSRHVIDLNRPASGEALYSEVLHPGQTETELCPTTTFDFKSIYKAGTTPNQAEIERRIKLYWQPYHDQLQQLINSAKEKFGFCVLIDAHSIDDQVPRFFDGTLPDINVGTFAGKSCSPEIESMLLGELAKQDQFSVVANGRFKGGFITRNYGDPGKRVHAIQLEHAKGCYLGDDLKPSAKSTQLRQFWRHTLEKLSKSLQLM